MKKKLSVKFILTVMLSAVLFCMPAGAYFANGSHAVEVHAQEETEESSPEKKAEDENTEEIHKEEDGLIEGGSGEGSSEEREPDNTGEDSDPEEEKPGEDGSGENDPEDTCTCKEKCSQYEVDKNCKVCSRCSICLGSRRQGDGYIRNETGRCRKYRALHKEIETEQNGNHEFQEYALRRVLL